VSAFTAGNKDQWDWTMMIMQPDPVSQELLESVRQKAIQTKGIPALEQARLERVTEGLSAQTMYLGAYKAEGPTIGRLHDFIHAQGFELSGKHHEIYLGDPRKSAPERNQDSDPPTSKTCLEKRAAGSCSPVFFSGNLPRFWLIRQDRFDAL
jgi:hypothetical protein